jgi:hypothetical protein
MTHLMMVAFADALEMGLFWVGVGGGCGFLGVAGSLDGLVLLSLCAGDGIFCAGFRWSGFVLSHPSQMCEGCNTRPEENYAKDRQD